MAKSKAVIMGVSSLILVAMVVAVAVGVSKGNNAHSRSATEAGSDVGEINSSMKAITAMCAPTDHKEKCEKTLASAGGNNTTDPRQLIQIAFNVTVSKVKEALAASQTLKDAEKDPRTSKALETCKEVMGYAIDDLKSALMKFQDFDLAEVKTVVDDLKSWLSASLTYEDTCRNGFDDTTGPAGAAMHKALVGASELSSISLAIVTKISEVLGGVQIPSNRRLLSSNEFPSWVSDGSRSLLEAGPSGIKPNVVVAQDESGDFKTVNDAVSTIPRKSKKTYVIYVKKGVYNEAVIIEKDMWNVMIIGDGPTKTVITGNANYQDGTPTYMTATLAVVGDGFIGKDFGVENTAGPKKNQAVAIRVQSDKSVLYNCKFDGYRGTLYAHTHRQFYRDCTISGTVDFIFGDAAVVFQNCKIVVRKPLDKQKNTITAQGRTDRHEATGTVLQNCTIVGEPGYIQVKDKIPTFLGCPWKEYSRTLYIQSNLGDFIYPDGWLACNGDFGLKTCFFGEFQNQGPSASLAKRVKWEGLKTSMTAEQAEEFTVPSFIQGDQWIPRSEVPFIPGLLPANSD